jgi:hypothetical protein
VQKLRKVHAHVCVHCEQAVQPPVHGVQPQVRSVQGVQMEHWQALNSRQNVWIVQLQLAVNAQP